MNRGGYVTMLSATIAVASCAVSFDVGPRADSGPSADGGGKTCTAVQADFCADFEDGPVESGWDGKLETSGGTVALDSTRAFGSSRSAVSRPPRGNRTQASMAALEKAFGGRRSCKVEFDAWVTTPTWGQSPNFAIANVGFQTKATSAYFAMFIDSDALSLSTQTPSLAIASSNRLFPYDRWVHVAIDIDWSTRSVAASLDGVEIVAKTFPAVDFGSDVTTNVQVGFLGYNPPLPEVDVNIDNVVVSRR